MMPFGSHATTLESAGFAAKMDSNDKLQFKHASDRYVLVTCADDRKSARHMRHLSAARGRAGIEGFDRSKRLHWPDCGVNLGVRARTSALLGRPS